MTARRSDGESQVQRSLGRNIAVLLGSQTVTGVLSTVVGLIIPRLFGPEAMGRYVLAVSIGAIASIVIVFGSGMAVTIVVAREPTRVQEFIGPALRLRIVMSLVTWPVVIVVLALFHSSRDLVELTAIVAIGATVGVVADLYLAALTGLERMNDIAQAEVVAKVAYVAAALLAMVTFRDLRAVAAALIVLSLIRVVTLRRGVRRPGELPPRTSWRSTASMLRRSVPYFVATGAVVVYQQVDVVMMSVLVDEREIGWYGAANGLFTAMLFAPNIAMMALVPAFSRSQTDVDDGAGLRLLAASFDALLLVAIPVAVATSVGARGTVELLFGEAYEGAAPVVSVFGGVLLLTFFSILFGSFAYATGRSRLWNTIMLMAILASIGLDLVLVPLMDRHGSNGAVGGALAYVVTEGLMLVVALSTFARPLLTWRRIWLCARLVASGAAAFAAGWAYRDRFVLVPTAVALVAYVVGIVVTRVLDPDLRAAIGRRRPAPGDADEDQSARLRSLLEHVARTRPAVFPDSMHHPWIARMTELGELLTSVGLLTAPLQVFSLTDGDLERMTRQMSGEPDEVRSLVEALADHREQHFRLTAGSSRGVQPFRT